MGTFRLTTWDPFPGLRYMQRELERVIGRNIFGDIQQSVGGGNYPPVNVYNSADNMIVQCEVPGVAREDLDISITGETLVVRGVKRAPEGEETFQYQRRERGSGGFSRTIVLPDKVDPDRIEAKLESGILTIKLPKSEAAKPRQINVK